MDIEIDSNNWEVKFFIKDHLSKLFLVILAFKRIKGRFSFLIFRKKLGQISESTKEMISGFQLLKKLLINNLES